MTQINIRIDDALKRDVDEVLDEIGISLSAAMTIFLKKVVRERRIPFELTAGPTKAREADGGQAGNEVHSVSTAAGARTERDGMCFLTEKDALWAGMLADVLKKESIPFVTRSSLGTGMAMKVGPMADRVSFFVPAPYLEDAKNITDGLFAEDAGGST